MTTNRTTQHSVLNKINNTILGLGIRRRRNDCDQHHLANNGIIVYSNEGK
jgi:hypothetical protein